MIRNGPQHGSSLITVYRNLASKKWHLCKDCSSYSVSNWCVLVPNTSIWEKFGCLGRSSTYQPCPRCPAGNTPSCPGCRQGEGGSWWVGGGKVSTRVDVAQGQESCCHRAECAATPHPHHLRPWILQIRNTASSKACLSDWDRRCTRPNVPLHHFMWYQ